MISARHAWAAAVVLLAAAVPTVLNVYRRPAEIAPGLMRAPVSSRGGLGIGLYQAARQAGAAGYRLALESNRDGNVCFALSGAPA